MGVPAATTVKVAEPDTQLVCISKENFEVILQDNPQIVLAILKEMTRRLKKTSQEKFNGGSSAGDWPELM